MALQLIKLLVPVISAVRYNMSTTMMLEVSDSGISKTVQEASEVSKATSAIGSNASLLGASLHNQIAQDLQINRQMSPYQQGEGFSDRTTLVSPTKSYIVDFSKELGSGAFGKVYTIWDGGIELAGKFINPGKKQSCAEEVKIMQAMRGRSPYIVNFTEAFEIKSGTEEFQGDGEEVQVLKESLVIVMEKVQGKELWTQLNEWYGSCGIKNQKPEMQAKIWKIWLEVVQAIITVHQAGYIYVDLKTENIICVNEPCTDIRVIDFGLSVQYPDAAGTPPRVNAGTASYMAPEVAQNNLESKSRDTTPLLDVWSLGILLYDMWFKRSPFDAETNKGSFNKIIKWDGWDGSPLPLTRKALSSRTGKKICELKMPDNMVSIIQKFIVKDPDARLKIVASVPAEQRLMAFWHSPEMMNLKIEYMPQEQ